MLIIFSASTFWQIWNAARFWTWIFSLEHNKKSRIIREIKGIPSSMSKLSFEFDMGHFWGFVLSCLLTVCFVGASDEAVALPGETDSFWLRSSPSDSLSNLRARIFLDFLNISIDVFFVELTETTPNIDMQA